MSMRVVLLAVFCVFSSTTTVAQPRIIFDTDLGGDADDLGALVMLLNMMNRGEAELLAVMAWTTEEYAVAAIDAVNRHYGHPDIPIGGRNEHIWHEDWQYSKPIVDALGSERTHENVPHPTVLYRKILAEQPDESVTVVTVGPLLNILELLESPPDSISQLPGPDLIRRKVKAFVIMGGEFPEGEGEWNFDGYMPDVTRKVVDGLDVPIVFSGWEIGHPIRTGSGIKNIDPSEPLYIGFRHFSEHAPWMKDQFEGEILANASYDQTAVLFAVRGGEGEWWDVVRGGHVEVDSNGDNRWIEGDVTNQAYLRLRAEPESLARLIESIMLNEF